MLKGDFFKLKNRRMKKLLLLGLSTAVLMILISAWKLPSTTEWKKKVSAKVLEKAQRDNAKVDFMVMFHQQTDVSDAKGLELKEEKAWMVYRALQEEAARSQQEILSLLNAKNIKHRSFYVVNAIQVIGDLTIVEELARRPEVAQIVDNPQVKLAPLKKAPLDENRDPDAIEWGIDRIDAEQVWDLGYRGQGVVIGGADTGYEWDHPAIKEQYRGWDGTTADHNYSWHDAIHSISPLHQDPIVDPSNNPCGLDAQTPCDDNDHGTFTIGIAVGDDGDANQIGVAPQAKWIGCRNMERGYGSPASYLECFEWFLAPTDINNENADPSKAPHVINNSWSCPIMEGCTEDTWPFFETAINNLRSSGVFVVVSAGNRGSAGCGSIARPSAIFENSFTIGSIEEDDGLSGFSSRGPVVVDNSGRIKPNVVAPGGQIRSAIRNGGYQTGSGTSSAGPHVAGLVALLISANPSLAGKVELLEDIIEQTAIPRTADEACGEDDALNIPNNQFGFGSVNALAAVELGLQTTSTTTLAEDANIRAFPNPVKNFVQFEFQDVDGTFYIELYNSAGQLMQRQVETIFDASQVLEVPMIGFSSGIYFYKITNEEGSFGGKLVKE